MAPGLDRSPPRGWKTGLPTNVTGVALLLAVLCLVNVYRASTQSITYDEAVTYDAFVVGPMSHAFTGYNANNHVLFTLTSRDCAEVRIG